MNYKPLIALIVLLCCCGEAPSDSPELTQPGKRSAAADPSDYAAPPDGLCSAEVVGFGGVDVETVYLPNLLRCELGFEHVPFETLKALAVVSRTYLYYKIRRFHQTLNDVAEQVVFCGNDLPPLQTWFTDLDESSTRQQFHRLDLQRVPLEHQRFYLAAQQTEGQVIMADGTQLRRLDDQGGVAFAEHFAGTCPECSIAEHPTIPDSCLSPYAFIPGSTTKDGDFSQTNASCRAKALGETAAQLLKFYFGETARIACWDDRACGGIYPHYLNEATQSCRRRSASSNIAESDADDMTPTLPDHALSPQVTPQPLM